MLPIKSSTKNRQRDDDVILPERQFNCPPCEQLKKSTCQIPSWVKPPCDGMKCFNCPPKYLCLNINDCQSTNSKEKNNATVCLKS